MDGLTFIAEIVKAIAWPVTVIILFLILKQPILSLFPLIQRLRFQALEIDFSRQVEALALEVRRQLPPYRSLTESETQMYAHWKELAPLSPRAVVLEAWIPLEQAASEASRQHGLNLKSSEVRAPLILGQALEEAGILDDNTSTIYHQLRNLRNAAVHASDFAFTPEAAIEYADLALRLVDYLRKA